MGTITVNIKDEVEKEFRAVARIVHGGEKGYLEEAVTNAMRRWVIAATMRENNIFSIYTEDDDFESIPWLTVINPFEVLAD